MSCAASLAALRAHADAWRGQRQRERDHAIWQDAEICRLWTLGWPQVRIAAHVELAVSTVNRRIPRLGLPPRPGRGYRITQAGLSDAERDLYLTYVRTGCYRAADARAEVLRQRRSAA